MSSLSPAMIGALVGLAFAVMDNVLIRNIANNAARSGRGGNASALKLAALSTLVVFPVVGYLVAPMVLN